MKPTAPSALFRQLPSVDDLMRGPAASALAATYGKDSLTDAMRVVLARLRQEIASGLLGEDALDLALTGLKAAVEIQLRQASSYSLRPVINATGVILHTNLGRAPLAEAAIEHIRETAASYSNLEFDLAAGARRLHVDARHPRPDGGDQKEGDAAREQIDERNQVECSVERPSAAGADRSERDSHA